MISNADPAWRRWGLPALTLFTFFFLLGARSLNEPDEGRYGEVAREMVESGDWLVPHLWYVPHLDKPPLTYWTVAASLSAFGQNEWAVRLPLALAGISGVAATFLLGCALGGRRAGFWSALILQSSLLYYVMARMLTTDIFLTQFVAWAAYFFWRSWRCLANSEFGIRNSEFFLWHLAGWAAIALAFLAKGPLAVIIPAVCVATLMIHGRGDAARRKFLLRGMLAGFVLFAILVVPWFLLVFEKVPKASDFMIFGQVVGHALGTTIKNRRGHPLYYFAIVGVGFLPWTWLLGWLWRRAHWRQLNDRQKEAWLMLSVWVLFSFILFSLMRSKLPAYILPIFPALSVMAALRWFTEDAPKQDAPAPDWVWRLAAFSPLILMAVIPAVLPFIFHVTLSYGLKLQIAAAILGFSILAWLARTWSLTKCAGAAFLLGLVNLHLLAADLPSVETALKRNQTLKPLGLALRETYRPGDAIACWRRFPQGLPFYSTPAINPTNRPYLVELALDQVPFAFPGNRERLGDLVLPDEHALIKLLDGNRRVLVVGFNGSFNHFKQTTEIKSLRLITSVGQWELFANR